MDIAEYDEGIVKKAHKEDALKLYTFLERVRAKAEGMLKERTLTEIETNFRNFITIQNKGKIIACGEVFQTENTFTLELGALAVDPDRQGNGFCDLIIDYAESFAKRERKYLILVTNNERLEAKLCARRYQSSPIRYAWRESLSPSKKVYVKY